MNDPETYGWLGGIAFTLVIAGWYAMMATVTRFPWPDALSVMIGALGLAVVVGLIRAFKVTNHTNN